MHATFNLLGIAVEVYQYNVSDDWCSINVEGPDHCVLTLEDYPEKPFACGCFQLAYRARVISPGKFLKFGVPYVFKQHHLEEYGVAETCDPATLSDEFLEELKSANEKKTAKVN